jgi:hypothetical protein
MDRTTKGVSHGSGAQIRHRPRSSKGEDHSRWISFEELSMIGGSHNKDFRIGW